MQLDISSELDLNSDINSVISPEIFRAYDIRGIVDQTLIEKVVFLIGKAIGQKTLLNGSNQVVVGRDGRLSGPKLIAKLIQGIVSSGCNVINIGLVPTPVLYFAASILKIDSAIMLTGSHNPPNYNGLKIILGGKAIYGEQILELRNMVVDLNNISGNYSNNNDLGEISELNIIDRYVQYIKNNININCKVTKKNHKLKIVVDCGNGAAGCVAEQLFNALDVECIPLYCEVDGNFPNHHPDPGDPNNLQDLQLAVLKHNADIGIAFDGDGDRLGIIDNKGNIIWPDRYLMLFAKEILQNNNNAVIIYDIKSTNHLHTIIKKYGGQPLMWKTGHSLIKAKMQETNALLAGEMSGHVFFKDRWFGFDDGLYTAARLIELLSNSDLDLYSICKGLPENIATPEIVIKSSETKKHHIIEQLITMVNEEAAQITTIDGIRLDFNNCWGLVRASNTTPNLIARFEAVDLAALEKIKAIFKNYLLQIDTSLSIPF